MYFEYILQFGNTMYRTSRQSKNYSNYNLRPLYTVTMITFAIFTGFLLIIACFSPTKRSTVYMELIQCFTEGRWFYRICVHGSSSIAKQEMSPNDLGKTLNTREKTACTPRHAYDWIRHVKNLKPEMWFRSDIIRYSLHVGNIIV